MYSYLSKLSTSSKNDLLLQWKWLATTLNPYYEGNDVCFMINEDRLIMNSKEHWTFLADKTGNIMDCANMKFLVKKAKKCLGSVHLVTADGSIDCQNNPNEQEAMVVHLHFAEILGALLSLDKGGTFLVKMFTFFECQTVCNLFLLACLFDKVQTIFKKLTESSAYASSFAHLVSEVSNNIFIVRFLRYLFLSRP